MACKHTRILHVTHWTHSQERGAGSFKTLRAIPFDKEEAGMVRVRIEGAVDLLARVVHAGTLS